MELKGSKTEQSLWDAFKGESMARNKYTYYSSVAKKAGFEQISAIFTETADNEKEHAKLWAKLLGLVNDTKSNLSDAAAGEYGEWTQMYPDMAKIAHEEGFTDIARMFEGVAEVEKVHHERYKKLLENLNNGMVFKKDGIVVWKCRNCGHIHVGAEAPDICPVCSHPKAHFEIRAENY